MSNPFDFVLWILELAGESDANEILNWFSGLWGKGKTSHDHS